MRNYWIRIAAGALGIFAVGMLLITAGRSVKMTVHSAINSSDPIPIPLIGLVPFRLGDAQLGSLSRLEFLRSDPQHLSGVRVLVKLADSVSPDRLRECQIALDDVENINEHTTFRCRGPQDSASGLEPFGVIIVRGTGDSFPLLLPGKTVADIRQTTFQLNRDGFHVTSPADRAREHLAARTDSMRTALEELVEAREDSVEALRDQADQLEDSAAAASASERRGIQRSADSVRLRMRQLVDRLRAGEARMHAFHELAGFSPAELDSVTQLGPQLSDSVRREVARTLRAAAMELERHSGSSTGARVRVTSPAPPAPPAPVRP
jgi:hypothetical protein